MKLPTRLPVMAMKVALPDGCPMAAWYEPRVTIITKTTSAE